MTQIIGGIDYSKALGAPASTYQVRVFGPAVAAGGSGTVLVDPAQSWEIDFWKGDEVRFTIGGIEWRQLILANIATTLVFSPLPPTFEVTLGLPYEIWRYIGIADISKWGGTALTGRDISLDLANLDVGLSTRVSETTFANVQSSLLDAVLTTAQSITLDISGRTVISFQAWSSMATTFTLESSFDNLTWRVVKTYAAVTSASEGFMSGMGYWRLRSAVAGTTGDTVSLVLQAGR